MASGMRHHTPLTFHRSSRGRMVLILVLVTTIGLDVIFSLDSGFFAMEMQERHLICFRLMQCALLQTVTVVI